MSDITITYRGCIEPAPGWWHPSGRIWAPSMRRTLSAALQDALEIAPRPDMYQAAVYEYTLHHGNTSDDGYMHTRRAWVSACPPIRNVAAAVVDQTPQRADSMSAAEKYAALGYPATARFACSDAEQEAWARHLRPWIAPDNSTHPTRSGALECCYDDDEDRYGRTGVRYEPRPAPGKALPGMAGEPT